VAGHRWKRGKLWPRGRRHLEHPALPDIDGESVDHSVRFTLEATLNERWVDEQWEPSKYCAGVVGEESPTPNTHRVFGWFHQTCQMATKNGQGLVACPAAGQDESRPVEQHPHALVCCWPTQGKSDRGGLIVKVFHER
jgi:hypothetical protein